MGRHWHFFAVFFWILNGAAYWTLLFATGNWARLIPTSWSILPAAWHTFVNYLRFHAPSTAAFHPYDATQQLAYAFVVFIMAPLTILSGATMSPAIAARFPWYPRLFGGRQKARSLHFLLMVGYVIFFLIHVTLVSAVNFPVFIDEIVLGHTHTYQAAAIAIGMSAIGLTIVGYIWQTVWSRRNPRAVQHMTGYLTDWLMYVLLARLVSVEEYRWKDISPYFWVNGEPPVKGEWVALAEGGFRDWRLHVHGLVEQPLELSLADLRALPQKRQITEHVCIQGWSGFAEWEGVPLTEIVARCRPLASAHHVVFHSFQVDEQGVEYYNTLLMEEVVHPQTILAHTMNRQPLPIYHGAPLRLRVETKLGFKMTKYLRSIEFVEDYRTVGQGHGGYREDNQYFSTGAEI